MFNIECTLQVLTPAFVGGAESAATADDGLRIPALKGSLRFWWRTMYGGLPVHELSWREAQCFGDTLQGQGLRISPSGRQLPPVVSTTFENDPDLGYAGYGVVEYFSDRSTVQRGYRAKRSYYGPGTQVSLRLTHRHREHLSEAARALWLFGAFGAVGARSRRGLGSIDVLAWRGDVEPPYNLPNTCRSPSELAGLLRRAVDGYRTLEQEPLWPALSKASRVFVWNKSFPTATEALAAAIRTLRRFRGLLGVPAVRSPQKGPDHDLVYQFLEEGRADRPPRRVAFGLPHNYHLTHCGKRPGRSADKVTIVPPTERRASPLLFRVTRLAGAPGGAQFVPIVVFLPSQFLPPGTAITLEASTGRRAQLSPPADVYSVIHDYLDGCRVDVTKGGESIKQTWPGLREYATEV